MKTGGPNAEQIRYWNEVAGPRWVTQDALLDAQITPLGLRGIERAAPAAGERVLDVGCGCGSTTVELGRRVGSGGAVLGVDLSAPMLERATARAREADLGNVAFVQADVQTHAFDRGFDLAFSRFGVMFFADPTAAFANVRGALAAGGRLAFICWAALQDNPWMVVPLGAVARHVPLPAPPEPGAPGPFAFADPERVRAILSGAGLRDVQLEPLRETVLLGGEGPLERAVDLLIQIGPAGAALREADPALLPKVREAVLEAVAPFYVTDPTPGVRMPASAWIVTARRD